MTFKPPSGLSPAAYTRTHAATAHIPIIVVSGTDTRDLNPANFKCVLRKPVDADALIAAVAKCLEG